jgi:DNA-binding MarR family transcriptional regulator
MTGKDPETVLGPGLDFLRELWALDHALQKLSKRMSRALGVSGPQRLALRLVARFPGMPAGRLARLLHLHPSTVSGLVKGLVDRGLIARSPSSLDRRRSPLRITAGGIELLSSQEPTIESAVLSALQSIPPARIDAALKVLASVSMKLSALPRAKG